MPFIPVKSEITLVGAGGNANTATSALTASTLYNSSSLFGILQISNSNDTSAGGYDISASHALSKRAPTCIINATTISHSATNITYSATNVLHTASSKYQISAVDLTLYAADNAGNGGLKIYNGTNLITDSILYANSQGYVRGLTATQTGEIPVFNSSTGWTTVHSSSLTAGYAASANSLDSTLGVSGGGTGRTSLTASAILLGNGTSPVNFLTASVPSGSFIISDGTAWKVLPTSSLAFAVTTASYLESQYDTGLYIGFESSSTSQKIKINSNPLVGLSSIDINAKTNINITSDVGDINLSCSDLSNKLTLTANAGIEFNSQYSLTSSDVITISGTPTQIGPLNYNYPIWKISASVANKTASILGGQVGLMQLICNVSDKAIWIDLTGANSSPDFLLGAYSSSQIYGFASNRWLKIF